MIKNGIILDSVLYEPIYGDRPQTETSGVGYGYCEKCDYGRGEDCNKYCCIAFLQRDKFIYLKRTESSIFDKDRIIGRTVFVGADKSIGYQYKVSDVMEVDGLGSRSYFLYNEKGLQCFRLEDQALSLLANEGFSSGADLLYQETHTPIKLLPIEND